MGINARVVDRDPCITLRRVLLVITAVGATVPAKVTRWVAQCVGGGDGDIVKVVAWATAAERGKVTPIEAVGVIRDVCIKRLGDSINRGRS